jgi:hypothetical protein
MLTFRDPRGRVLFHLDKDDDVPRGEDGKPIAQRAGKDAELVKLSRYAGKRMASVLLDLGEGDVLVPSTRADFGMPDFRQDYIADLVSPVTFVKRDRGYYFTENIIDGIKIVQAQANPVGPQAELNPGFTATAFTTVGYALAAKLGANGQGGVVDNADFDLKKRTVRFLVDALRRGREARVATLTTTATTFAAGNQIAAVAKWNLSSGNPAPLTDLFKALQASYLPSDTLVLPEIAAQYFHYTNGGTGAQIRDFVQGGGQLPRILYAKAKQFYNDSPAYIWMPTGLGNVPLVRTTVHDDGWIKDWKKKPTPGPILYEPDWEPNDAITDIGTTHTLRWLGEHPNGKDSMRQYGVLVREYVDEQRSTWIAVAMSDIEIVPSNLVGAIITGALA